MFICPHGTSGKSDRVLLNANPERADSDAKEGPETGCGLQTAASGSAEMCSFLTAR